MKKFIVYCHTLKSDGRKYIGITGQNPKKRWNYGNGYTSYFRNAIKKYGWNNFEHTILFEDLTEQEAIQKEIELIKELDLTDREKGFNLCYGGQGTNGYVFNEKDIEKMRISHLGKKLTEEQKQKISLSLREHYSHIPKKPKPLPKPKGRIAGFHLSEKTKEKLRQANLGKKQSEETILKRTKKIEKPIDMLTIAGEYIKTFSSITEASNETKTHKGHITEVCKEKRISANNLKWRYTV